MKIENETISSLQKEECIFDEETGETKEVSEKKTINISNTAQKAVVFIKKKKRNILHATI